MINTNFRKKQFSEVKRGQTCEKWCEKTVAIIRIGVKNLDVESFFNARSAVKWLTVTKRMVFRNTPPAFQISQNRHDRIIPKQGPLFISDAHNHS